MARPLPYVPASRQTRLELALQRELDGDERVIWKGKQLARVSLKAFAIYLFAVPWTAFALFWTAMASFGVSAMEDEGPAGWMAWAFPLFGVPFVLVGIAMLSTPFIPLWQRGKVVYAITNRRILRLSLGRSLNVKSVPSERLGLVDRHETRLGHGSLKLAVRVGTDSDGDKRTEHFDLGEVADVMGAHEAIRRLRRSHTEGLAL